MHVVQKHVGQIRAELEETLQLCSGVFQREAARSLITPDSSKASSSGLVPPAASGDASSLLTVVSDTVEGGWDSRWRRLLHSLQIISRQ